MISIVQHKWKIFIGITITGFFFDWLTKYFAVTDLKYGVQVPVIGSVLQWQLIYNQGALFGINPRALMPSFPVTNFFYVLSGLAMILILLYYRHSEARAILSQWGICLIMPGAVGNLFDRIIRPGLGVVDFIRVDLGFRPFHPWPIFNLADAYITVGLSLIILDLILQERSAARKKKGTPVQDAARRP
jgi:signal peptidase II